MEATAQRLFYADPDSDLVVASQRDPERFIDLYDQLEQSGPRNAYFEDDPHWSSTGHRVVAEALYDETRDLVAR